jgi:hypothetical protein
MVISPKSDLLMLSTGELLAMRRGLALRLGEVEPVLFGSMVEQTRRCGKVGCRCAKGDPHGPYHYLSPSRGGHGMRYVPASMAAAVAACIGTGGHVEVVLAEISAINVELLARRALR